MTKLFPEEQPVGLNNDDNLAVPADKQQSAKRLFIICSLIGVLLFLTPLFWNEKWTIGIGILADGVKPTLKPVLPTIALVIVCLSALLTLWVALAKPAWSQKSTPIASIFSVSWIWVLLRVVGAIFIVMIYFQVGPDWVISKFTGGVILNDLNPTLIPFFFFAVMLLPFLTDYGLMEYIGTLLSKPFKKIFRLPGRAAIDASASWLGAAPVGVLITAQQYEKGYYNTREASTISTNFSLASAAFCLIIVDFMGIAQLFVPFYLTVIFTGIIAAIIISRIPPLSMKKATYMTESKQISEAYPEGGSAHAWGVKRAVARAHATPNVATVVKNSAVILADVYLGLMPVVFAIGTIALSLSEFTSVFKYLSAPLVPYLELLQVPEAGKAAAAIIVGFADMFLPAVLGKGIENEMTKFIIACMSVLQVIYMTEVGALILKAKLGLNILELFIIFLLRTLICLPIVVLIANTLIF